MSEPTRGMRLIILAALVLGIIAALNAGAAPEGPAGNMKVAAIDPSRVLNEYNGTVSANAALKKYVDDSQTTLQTYKSNPLLPEADQKRLGELTVKEGTPAGLNDAEKAEKKRISDKSQALFTELTQLQTRQAPNEAEKTRITELTKLAGDTDNRIQFASKEVEDQVRKDQSTNMAKIIKEVRESIAKVAKKDGYNLILSNEMAWYADNDITDAVLKDLNAKK